MQSNEEHILFNAESRNKATLCSILYRKVNLAGTEVLGHEIATKTYPACQIVKDLRRMAGTITMITGVSSWRTRDKIKRAQGGGSTTRYNNCQCRIALKQPGSAFGPTKHRLSYHVVTEK